MDEREKSGFLMKCMLCVFFVIVTEKRKKPKMTDVDKTSLIFSEIFGYISCFCISCQLTPQVILNISRQSTHGLSLLMISIWNCGGVMLIAYTILTEQPFVIILSWFLFTLHCLICCAQLPFYQPQLLQNYFHNIRTRIVNFKLKDNKNVDNNNKNVVECSSTLSIEPTIIIPSLSLSDDCSPNPFSETPSPQPENTTTNNISPSTLSPKNSNGNITPPQSCLKNNNNVQTTTVNISSSSSSSKTSGNNNTFSSSSKHVTFSSDNKLSSSSLISVSYIQRWFIAVTVFGIATFFSALLFVLCFQLAQNGY